MRKLLPLITLAFSLAASAQNVQLGTKNTATKDAGVHTYSTGTICLKEPSGSDVGCVNAPALSGSVVWTFPSATSTLATTASTFPYTQITGMGTGVSTWLGTPTGANFMSILGCSGTVNFLRADGTCTAPTGSGDVVGPSSVTDGRFALFDGTTGKLIKQSAAAPAASATTDTTDASNISSGTLPDARLANTVSASSCTSCNLTYDAHGRITVAANGGAGGGGGLTFVETHSASNSATLDFTTCISSTYDNYLFLLQNVLAQTSTANLLMRVGTGGTPTYDTGSNYKWSRFSSDSTAATGAAASGGDTSISLQGSVSSVSTSGQNGRVLLYGPNDTTFHKHFRLEVSGITSGGSLNETQGGGDYASATAVTAVRFFFSTGNIVSGKIDCYGYQK